MAQQALPSVPNPKRTEYSNILGVDFRADQTEVDRRRSPNMVNMISDVGGNPVKRAGYRMVARAYAGIALANSESYAVYKTLSGTVVVPVSISGATQTIVEDSSRAIVIDGAYDFGSIKDVFGYQQYIFIMCDSGCVKVDVTKYADSPQRTAYEITGIKDNLMSEGALGASAPACEEIIPLTAIALDHQGYNGVSYDGKNLFSIYQKYSYQGDGEHATFKIPLYSKIGAWAKVEVMDNNGNWVEKTQGVHYTLGSSSNVSGVNLDGKSVSTFSVVDSTITFTSGNIPPAPSQTLAGEDNVRITCAPFNMAEDIVVDGVTAKRGYFNETFLDLLESSAHFFYEQRLFVGVVEKTFYSEINNPFLVSDNSWFDVDNAVIAYQRVSNYLVIITKDTGKNTIFLANSTTTTDSESGATTTQFSVKPSNAGVGAITSKVGGILNDEPIFLSSTGVYGILTNWNSEKYAVNRSGRINRRLCKESGLENAVGCAFNQYYYLAVNGQMYILDGRHKDSTRSGETSYECYYFNNIPTVRQMFVADNRMFFTDETYTYTWNDDLPERVRYYDNLVLDSDGNVVSGMPVHAWWSSPFDDDGIPEYLKTLKKKGTLVTLVPHYETGCYITLLKNGDEYQELAYSSGSIFTFNFIDFAYGDYDGTWHNGISFLGNAVAHDRFTKKKIKKYKRLQIVVGNDKPEPFGLTQVVKTYEVGNFAKR